MSWRASAWAKGVKTGNIARKAVLLVLAENCDQWGWVCWIDQKAIADEAEASTRTIQRHLDDLAKSNLLTVFRVKAASGKSWRNLYYLAFMPEPKEEMPSNHPSRNQRYEPTAGPGAPGFVRPSAAPPDANLLSGQEPT